MSYAWQQQQWNYLLSRRKNNTLPHGILLTGLQGMGKLDFARKFAALLLCQAQDDTSCGSCHACKLMQAKNHPDFYLLQPEVVGKAIKVDQVRQIIAMLNKRSHQGGYQVVIIDPADAMNIAASNALLKTLEEPQGEVVIMLLSSKPATLSATVISRCQRVNFAAPDAKMAKEWLAPQLDDSHDIELLLKLAENAPLQALALSKGEMLSQRTLLLDSLERLIKRDIDPIKFASLCSKLELPFILSSLQLWLLDMLYRELSSKLFVLADKITNYQRHLGNNLNQQLVLEDLSITIQEMRITNAS